MTQGPDEEEAELRLIQLDAVDAVRALLAFRLTPVGGYIGLLALPAAALVAEESHQYFMRRRREHRIGRIRGELFERFGRSVKKVRARLKLFDDTDTGPENLVEFLALVRRQSRVLFSHPTNSFIQLLSGPFRPDLGAYFRGEHLVATTHALLPATGVTLELVRNLQPGQFSDFNTFAFNFAKAMGAHFRTLAEVLDAIGLAVDLEPTPEHVDWTITHNDFVGERFYRRAERAIPGAERLRVPALTLCLGQVNTALHVLPAVLGEHSNLLARVRFLTAFHGSNAVRTSNTNVPGWVSDTSTDFLLSSCLRNVFAHYELRDAAQPAVAVSNPLVAAVEGVAQVSWHDVMNATSERLDRLAQFLGHSLTKSCLCPARALLGDHT